MLQHVSIRQDPLPSVVVDGVVVADVVEVPKLQHVSHEGLLGVGVEGDVVVVDGSVADVVVVPGLVIRSRLSEKNNKSTQVSY